MEIFNIGPLELIVILVLMFIIMGPKDMVKTAQRIGAWVRSITRSPMWREVWGISQDIRELPKKLMEETGLDEALTDVKQTTQEVADELNAQINEAKEAARVPEAEHVRIETNPLIGPPPNSVPAELSSTVESPVRLEAVQPAELKVAEAAGTEALAASEAGPADTSAPETASEMVQPAPVKKTRRSKKQADVAATAPGETPAEPSAEAANAVLAEVETSLGGVSLTEPSAPFWPVTQFFPPDAADRVLSFPTPAPPPSNGQSGVETAHIPLENAPAEPAPQPPPRKRRLPKAVTTENEPVEPATSGSASGNGTAKQARARKPRQPKAVVPAHEASEPGAEESQPEASPSASNYQEAQPDPSAAQLDRDAA